MKNLLIPACALALLSGCAAPPPATIDNEVSNAMLDKNLVQVFHPTPDFMAIRVGKKLLGAWSDFSMRSAGANILARNQIGDPARAIGNELARELATSRGARLVRAPVTLETRKPAAIAAAVKGAAAYALEVETQEWDLHYFSDFTHYRVRFILRARLLDIATGKVLADSSCDYIPDSKEPEPTYTELVNDGAAGLKGELAKASARCLGKLKRELLNL